MKTVQLLSLFALAVFSLPIVAASQQVLFQDDFKGKLGEGWSWIREDRQGWRATQNGLEVRVAPGNMWGPKNDAKNVLLRPAPEPSANELQVSVTLRNQPSHQYEQVDLVWYYNDSHMVKLGQELVDGKLSIVMGREQADKTQTIAIIPLASEAVTVRFRVKEDQIRGEFRIHEAEAWREVGACELPKPPGAKPKLSLQFYQGPDQEEHWARVTAFRVTR